MRFFQFFAVVLCLSVFTACGNSKTDAPKESPNAAMTTAMGKMETSKAPKININSAILSELDKFEAKLGVAGLSNRIQAERPYGSPEDLVTKKVVTQEQFNQIKDMVSIEDVVLTGEAKDVDYMVKLGLMKGHMLVAKELLDLKKPDQAEPHIGHPVEEIYVDVEDQLKERNVKEFKTTLVNLQDLIKSTPNDPKVGTSYTAAMRGIDDAIQALPEAQRQSPGFVIQVIDSLLQAANTEYSAAIANGKISAAIEYQDSRGFVLYAHELYKGVASQMAKSNPEAHKVMATKFSELLKAWPSAIAPPTPILTTKEVSQLVGDIQAARQKMTA
ncbi:MAG: helix-hairpin-helix domain-containing protein [Gloeobacterales cyanobacterium]